MTRQAVRAALTAVTLLLTTSLLLPPAPAAQTKPSTAPPATAPAATQPAAAPAVKTALSVQAKPWTGDFDAMVKRRIIRVLVPHSKTMYFVERGQPRGIVYEAFKAWREIHAVHD